MVPNELRELDFSIGGTGGSIEIKGCQNGNSGTPIKLTSLELITLPDFIKGNDNRLFIIRNGKRKDILDFYPKFSQYRLYLDTYSRVKFVTKQVTLFFSAQYTTIRVFAKGVDATEFIDSPSEY